MYRLNGFLLLLSGLLAFGVGGWLLWLGISDMLQASAPLQATRDAPEWLWILAEVSLAIFLLYFSVRLFRAGIQLFQEEESVLFFLPAESWPFLVGLVAVIALGYQLSSTFHFFGASELPQQCAPRLPMSKLASGPEWVCWPNGSWARAGQWKRGKKTGMWREWHNNGKRKWVGTYLDGKKHGVFAYYNKMGRQVAAYRYKNDVLDGPYILRYDRGEMTPLKLQGFYRKGQKCGSWVYWDAFLRQGLLQQKRSRVETYPACAADDD